MLAPRLFRVDPQMPAANYKTYQISAPLSTHFRVATCQEVQCAAWIRGWTTVVDAATDLGGRQANYIRLKSGRHFTFTQAGTVVTFRFPPGQRCFREHQTRLDRAEIFVVRGGDWRGNPRGVEPRVHRRAADWVDDFAEHQDKLATRLAQG
jgi:hypothetical protein